MSASPLRLSKAVFPTKEVRHVASLADLLFVLSECCDQHGRYYGDALLVKGLLWWQPALDEDKVEEMLVDLERTGDITRGRWLACTYGSENDLGLQIVRKSQFRRFRPRPPISADLRAAVYERDGHACVVCSVAHDITLDHIVPYSHGGEDTLENLQTMCRPCNSRKGNRV